MKSNLAKNFIYQASYQFLLIVLPIITIPIVSKALGPDGIGKYQFVFSVTSYFTLVAGLGIQNYGVREIAIVRTDRKLLSEKFWELFFFNSSFSILVLSIYLFIIPFFNDSFYFFIQSMLIISCVFDISWLLGGLEDFKTLTLRNFIIKILTFLSIYFFIKDKSDLILYFFIMGTGTLLGQLSIWLTIKKYIDWVPVSRKKILSHLRPSLSFFLAKIAFQFYYNVSLTLLGLFATFSDVGFFSNGYNLVAVAGSIINSLNTVMIPRMSSLFNDNNEEEMIELLQKTIHIQLFFSIAISFGIITINNKMIPWFYGPDFTILKIIVPLLSIGLVFQILQTAIAAQYLIPKKQMKAYNFTVIIGAIVNFVISIISIPLLGIYGAVIGYLVSYILLCYMRADVLLKTTSFKFNWKLIIGSVFSGAFMFLFVYTVTYNLRPSVSTTIIQVLLGSVVFLACSILLKLNKLMGFTDLSLIFQKAKKIFKK
ncbi:PST family polysaccharide transporter [Enterococcus innesii]|uniref:PST family polysaccharide transporter n=1 Tax=Enterococcus innesii TaxID=2839759 RepID=A0ABM7XPS4_9ENTE|nr:oligosaccharide flippase family protein [Enterococcus innesii]BDG67016.1 PST family polysaccharide transporter [Enterococcus innesii]